MIRIIAPALALVALSVVAGYSLSERAGAQSAPAAQVENTQVADVSAASRLDRPQRPWMRGRQQSDYRRMASSRTLGLFYPQTDKKLSVGDVQTIAEAILLRRGNTAGRLPTSFRTRTIPSDSLSRRRVAKQSLAFPWIHTQADCVDLLDTNE